MLTWLLGPAVVLVARAVRRADRRHDRRRRRRGDRLRRRDVEGHPPGVHRARHRRHHRVHRHQDRLRHHAALRQQARRPRRLPRRPDLHVVAGGARPRHQRRAEDDGRHHPRCSSPRASSPPPTPSRRLWVIFACAITIALGTYMGGWRIIRTLGKGLTDVKPAQGFSAESVDGIHDPRLERARLRAVDHAGRLGFGDRIGPRPPRLARCAGAPSAASWSAGC